MGKAQFHTQAGTRGSHSRSQEAGHSHAPTAKNPGNADSKASKSALNLAQALGKRGYRRHRFGLGNLGGFRTNVRHEHYDRRITLLKLLGFWQTTAGKEILLVRRWGGDLPE